MWCDQGWEHFGYSCYFFDHTASKDAVQAKAACIALGAQLVTIHSQEEQDFLAGLCDFMLYMSSYIS